MRPQRNLSGWSDAGGGIGRGSLVSGRFWRRCCRTVRWWWWCPWSLRLPTILSFHNLCTGKIQPSVASKQLLGLGLKYRPRTQTPRQQIKVAIEELQRTVRTRAYVNKLTRPKRIYNKKLYKKNEEWIPDKIIEGTAEVAMLHFAEALSNQSRAQIPIIKAPISHAFKTSQWKLSEIILISKLSWQIKTSVPAQWQQKTITRKSGKHILDIKRDIKV